MEEKSFTSSEDHDLVLGIWVSVYAVLGEHPIIL